MANESLKVVAGNATGSSIALEDELVIGRSTPGLGSLGGDSEISRVHARVYHDASGQLMVEDLGSTNGTYVNGARLTGSQQLRPGDQLKVGQTTMSVEGGAEATQLGGAAIIPPAAASSPPPTQTVGATPPTQQFPAAQPPAAQPPAAPPPAASPAPVGGGPIGGGPIGAGPIGGGPIGGGPPGGPRYAGGPIGGPPGKKTGGSPNKGLLIGLGVLVVAGLVVGALFIFGVFDSGDSETVTVKAKGPAIQTTGTAPVQAMPTPDSMPKPTDTGGDEYPEGFLDNFISMCSTQGIPRDVCECWTQSIQDNYTYQEFVDADAEARSTGNLPPDLQSSLQNCIAQG